MSLISMLGSVLRGFYVETKSTVCGSTLRNHNREQVNGRGNPSGPWQEVDRCCHFSEITVRDRLLFVQILLCHCLLLFLGINAPSLYPSISDVTSYDFHNRSKGRGGSQCVKFSFTSDCYHLLMRGWTPPIHRTHPQQRGWIHLRTTSWMEY